jgi:hypothetical protein
MALKRVGKGNQEANKEPRETCQVGFYRSPTKVRVQRKNNMQHMNLNFISLLPG